MYGLVCLLNTPLSDRQSLLTHHGLPHNTSHVSIIWYSCFGHSSIVAKAGGTVSLYARACTEHHRVGVGKVAAGPIPSANCFTQMPKVASKLAHMHVYTFVRA